MSDHYTGFAHCPYCFESCGFLGNHGTGYDGVDWFTMDLTRPCPECEGTGLVECEVRSLDDIENEVDPDAAAWVESIRALVHPDAEDGSTSIELGRVA